MLRLLLGLRLGREALLARARLVLRQVRDALLLGLFGGLLLELGLARLALLAQLGLQPVGTSQRELSEGMSLPCAYSQEPQLQKALRSDLRS